jgi:hypothetical protein
MGLKCRILPSYDYDMKVRLIRNSPPLLFSSGGGCADMPMSRVQTRETKDEYCFAHGTRRLSLTGSRSRLYSPRPQSSHATEAHCPRQPSSSSEPMYTSLSTDPAPLSARTCVQAWSSGHYRRCSISNLPPMRLIHRSLAVHGA